MNIDKYQLSLHNPWWEESFDIKHDIRLIELASFKYQYKHPLLEEFPINKDVVLTLRGPRQIGKTTLIKQIIQKLIGKKVSRGCIFYFPCDRIIDFNELFFLIQNYINQKRIESKKRLFIFLDEISFVKQWQRAIKSLVDMGLLRGVTLLITGSNAWDLKVSSERLPGRTGKYFGTDKLFLPLGFYDFYKLLNPKWDEEFYSRDLPKLTKYFQDYLLVGGFPNVINEYYDKKLILPETYANFIKWIEGDMHKIGKKLDNAYKLFKEIDKVLTTPVSFTGLAQSAVLSSQQTVQEYIELFEMIFVLYKVDHFSLKQKKTNFKKNKKFYFLDPFVHNAIIAKENGFLDDAFNYSKKVLLSNDKIDKRFEEVIGANLHRIFNKLYYGSYGKKNLEVDFVGFSKGKYELFEVKHSDSPDVGSYLEILRNMKSYKKINIVSRFSSFEEKQIGKLKIIPAPKFLTSKQFSLEG